MNEPTFPPSISVRVHTHIHMYSGSGNRATNCSIHRRELHPNYFHYHVPTSTISAPTTSTSSALSLVGVRVHDEQVVNGWEVQQLCLVGYPGAKNGEG